MLKQSVKLGTLIWALSLSSSFLVSLASKATAFPDNLYNSVDATNSYNSVNQPTRLEISLSHRQVTVYKGTRQINKYPIAIGRRGWETPKGTFRVRQMFWNPAWIHPFTGETIAGGDPENPLGHYWIGFWTNGKNWIGFHGTPNPESVGKPASHGCIRMYNKDIEKLFHQVNVGTPVTVVR